MPSAPFRTTLTAPSTTGGYGTFFPDFAVRPFSVGIGVTTTSTTISYTVAHTFDYSGSSAFISSNATWFDSSGISSATGLTAQAAYTSPVSAIRLAINSGSSAGATTMTCIQAG
jgi:hypothetical protein